MKIKQNKTRISLWLNNERFGKIEENKLIITNGYKNTKKYLWDIKNFKTIDECLKLLLTYLKSKNSNILLSEKELIKNYYSNIF